MRKNHLKIRYHKRGLRLKKRVASRDLCHEYEGHVS